MRFGQRSTYPPPGLYQRWVSEGMPRGDAARHFIDLMLGVSADWPGPIYGGHALDSKTRVTTYPWQSWEFEAVRHERRSVPASRGGLSWGIIKRGGVGYHESLAFVLNRHLGSGSPGPRYLQDVVDEVDEEESVRRTLGYFDTAEGQAIAERLLGSDPTREAKEDLVRAGVSATRYYTGASKGFSEAPSVAQAALAGRVTPEYLRALPQEFLPEKIAGLGEPEP